MGKARGQAKKRTDSKNKCNKKTDDERPNARQLRQQLCSMGSLGNVTDSALALILQQVAEIYEDPDAAVSRYVIGEQSKKEAKKYLTTCRLPLQKGGEMIWHLCRLDLLFQYFAGKSTWFRKALQDVVQRCGHHLRLVCYTDELTPGDAFAADLTRKAFAIYVSILEFGPERLTKMQSWLPLGLMRSTVVKQIDGGLPCVFRNLFRSWSCGEPLSVDTEGIVIELDEPTVFVFEEVINLQDLDAHRAQLAWKGIGSLKPCFKCRNCMKKGHSSVTESSWQIDITEFDTDKFDLATDADMWEVVDMIADAHGVEREQLEMAHGLHHSKHGIWQDKQLRGFCKPISGTRYDPMHVMFVGGVFGQAMWEYLSDCKRKKGITYEKIDLFMQADWRCPFHRTESLRRVRKAFTKKREAASNRKVGVKLNASEQLDVYPLIRRFAELHDCDELHDASISLINICEVADALQQAKRQHFKCRQTMAVLIKDLVRKYLDVRKAIYGKLGVKPKHHKLCHLWTQLLEDGFLMDCFILEHMHCMIKPLAEPLLHNKHFEKTCITRAVQVRCRQLEKKDAVLHQLIGDQKPSPELTAILKHPASVGLLLELDSGQQLHTEDILFVGVDFSRCFVIKACYVSAVPGLVLEELALVQVVTPSCSRWQRTFPTQSKILNLGNDVFVQLAHYWAIDGGVIEVLHAVSWE